MLRQDRFMKKEKKIENYYLKHVVLVSIINYKYITCVSNYC